MLKYLQGLLYCINIYHLILIVVLFLFWLVCPLAFWFFKPLERYLFVLKKMCGNTSEQIYGAKILCAVNQFSWVYRLPYISWRFLLPYTVFASYSTKI